MIARLHLVNSHPAFYEIIGYLDGHAFVMDIQKNTYAITKFHYRYPLMPKIAQDFIYECCMTTIQNNLLEIRCIQGDPESSTDEDVAAAILRETQRQAVADKVRAEIQQLGIPGFVTA